MSLKEDKMLLEEMKLRYKKMKKLRTIFLVVLIIISSIISYVSISRLYSLRRDKIQASERLKYAMDNTIDEEKKFATNPNYINAVNEYKMKQYNSAIGELKEEIKKYPQHAQAYYLLGKIYEEADFEKGPYYQKMTENYENYIKLKPEGKRITEAKLKVAQYNIYTGLRDGNPSSLDKAENYLKSLDQQNDTVRMSLGAIYLNRQNYEEAIKAFEKSSNLSPKEIELKYNSLGLAYLKKRDYSKAENAFDIAIKINPEDKYAYNNLGVVYVYQGKLTEARNLFKEALRLDPSYKKAQENLVWVDWEIRKKEH